MHQARRRRGYSALLAALALIVTACGTRLNDSAFVTNSGGTGTAAGNRTTQATAKGATATTAAGQAAGAAGAGATPGAGAGPAAGPDAGGGQAAPGGADGPNQASDTGVTENEIVIGNISAQDGILGDAFAPPVRGLQAFVQYTNDHGGVHGRQLRLETCNDSEDRTKNLSCAQDLVENKHVFALLADNTRAEGGSTTYLYQQNVPVFMGMQISNAAYRFPNYFGIYGTGCPRDGNTVCYGDTLYNTSGNYRWFKEHAGTHKAAVFYYGLIAISADAGQFIMNGLKLEGYDVKGYDVNFANPNFDQAVQDMKSNGTDIMFDTIDDGTNRKLCDTMQRYNFSVKAKVSTVVSYGDEIGTDFSDVCRNSIYITGSTASYDATDNPAVKEFRDAFSTYQPDAPLHQWSLEGWMVGKSFVDALNSMGPAPTRKGLVDWLNNLHGYTNGGLSIPIDWQQKDYQGMYAQEQAQNQGVYTGDCTAIAQWQDDQKGWVQRTAPQGDCYDGTWVYPTKASDRGD
ncbi:MAG TPA: ABC transporter substrate-binding protein [Acidimicrobiales bacterium]|nr:ABC transporter substrate-binding protein [Acidimicrobiales bacterium]